MERESADLILLNIGYAVLHGDWNYKHVNSPFARIYMVKEGTAKLHLPDKVQVLLPGHLYLIPPFMRHSYECDGYYSLYYIHIYEPPLATKTVLGDYLFPTEIDATFLDICLVKRLLEINPGRQLKEYDPLDYDNSSTLMQNIRQNLCLQPNEIFETRGILLQLLSGFLKDAVPAHNITDQRIKMSVRYIRKNLYKEIDLDTLAKMCYLSKDHFIRLFNEEVKTTPIKYINQKKIERAQLMLLTKSCPIKDIAYALAFNDVSYFNRLFKQLVGCTPTEYKSNKYI